MAVRDTNFNSHKKEGQTDRPAIYLPNGGLHREAQNMKILVDVSDVDREPCRKAATIGVRSSGWGKAA